MIENQLQLLQPLTLNSKEFENFCKLNVLDGMYLFADQFDCEKELKRLFKNDPSIPRECFRNNYSMIHFKPMLNRKRILC
ncbi:MAG: hypothetical protein LBJ32_04290 [Oscillospiraceae bacterium]|jgi:hypothetical protein|nr:hypothetical protein [Oscillospiraceae bacterium]